MKKTLLILAAAAATAAPMSAVTAEYYYTTSVPSIGTDTNAAHYTIYTLQSDTETVDSLASLYSTTKYADFISSAGTGIAAQEAYDATTMVRWDVTTPYEYGAVSQSSLFALWVYDSGTGDTRFMVIQAADLGYSPYLFAQGVDVTGLAVQPHSPWSRFNPEPTTATLSLLALIGIAARRRR